MSASSGKKFLVETEVEDEYSKAEQPKYPYFSEQEKKWIMKEYNKLLNHTYLSKEQKAMIRKKYIRMSYHQKVKFIERLYKLIENPDEAMMEDDYIVDVIESGAGGALAAIQLGVTVLKFVVNISKYIG